MKRQDEKRILFPDDLHRGLDVDTTQYTFFEATAVAIKIKEIINNPPV
jgi:hypothetical protein